MALDFSQRVHAAELMDGDSDYETFAGCLEDLATVNRLTLAARPTLGFLERLAKAGRIRAGETFRILDVASGFGDMLRLVENWGSRRGFSLELTGVDLNPHSERAARAATPAGAPIRYVTADIFDHAPEVPPDIVMSSLFTHHLTDADVVRFLRYMEAQARIGWLVNDLHRHRLPHFFFRHASRIGRFHPFVQHDGPVSIGRAFVRADWQRFLAEAEIPAAGTAVEWWMPFRLCVSRVRP